MKFSIAICVTLVLIGYATAHSCTKCQKPREKVQVFYEGEKCDCAGKTFPVHMERVKVDPPRVLKNFRYEIETVPLPEKPCYGVFSFHQEDLDRIPAKELKSHSYDVYSPPDPPPAKCYHPHSYHIEAVKPSPRRDPVVLYGHVDREVRPNEDCDEPKYKNSFPEVEFVKFRPAVKHHHEFYDQDFEDLHRDDCGACGNCPCTCHLKRRPHGRFYFHRYNDVSDNGKIRSKRYIPKFGFPDAKLGLFNSIFTPSSPSTASMPSEEVSETQITQEEMVARALEPNFIIPDHYDPVMRQEVSSEPNQFTELGIQDYQHLSKLLSQRTRMDPAYDGGYLSPAPAKQTQEMIKLLIDLLENKQDNKAYLSPTFENPHDWQHVVQTDDLALKVSKNDFKNILPVEELDKKPKITRIDNLQRNPQLPTLNQKKPLYGALDTAAVFYQQFKERSPVSVQQIVGPVYKVLDMKAANQVAEEKFTENFLKSLRIKRDTNSERHLVRIPRNLSNEEMSKKILHTLYERYTEILKEAEEHKVIKKRKKSKKLKKKDVKIIEKVEKANETESVENQEPNFVVLKGNSRLLLGNKLDDSGSVEDSSEEDLVS